MNKSNIILIILKCLIIITVMYIINFIINLLLDSIFKKRNKSGRKSFLTNVRIIKRIKGIVIFVVVVITCLFQIPNMNTVSWSLLSGAGVISLILGYAAQKTLSNFFCGLGIAFSDPFEIGDFIKCVDIDINGYVEDITLRHSVIRTIDNRRLIIPNSRLDDMTIENYNHTDNEVCRFVDYPIAYSANVDKALNIIKDEMGKLYNPNTNGINKNVEFPRVRVSKWDSSGIVIRCWVWGADNSMAHENIFHLNYIIKKRFDDEGIEIPYNYLNIIDRTEPDKGHKKISKKHIIK